MRVKLDHMGRGWPPPNVTQWDKKWREIMVLFEGTLHKIYLWDHLDISIRHTNTMKYSTWGFMHQVAKLWRQHRVWTNPSIYALMNQQTCELLARKQNSPVANTTRFNHLLGKKYFKPKAWLGCHGILFLLYNFIFKPNCQKLGPGVAWRWYIFKYYLESPTLQ